MHTGSNFCTSYPIFVISYFMDSNQPVGYEVLFYFGSDLHFSMDGEWCQECFHVLIDHLYIEEIFFKPFIHFWIVLFWIGFFGCWSSALIWYRWTIFPCYNWNYHPLWLYDFTFCYLFPPYSNLSILTAVLAFSTFNPYPF